MGEAKPENATKTNFAPLEGTYQILGELRGSEGTRSVLARRRSDGEDVTIAIYGATAGEKNNELSHYAADVKLLAELRHPNLVGVLEARWVGPAALAIVSERVQGSTLDDLLDREERFTNPRIGAILTEVYAVLDWARSRGVVHRGVPLDHLYFEEDTQRVRVSLAPTPIPISGVPDAGADAQTIGVLAWSMLTGQPYPAASMDQRLSELAPDLATRVVDATEELLLGKSASESVPDVPTILGILAAGDALKQTEVEMAALKEEYEAHHRAELAKCENHRMEVEQQAAEATTALADERKRLEKQLADREYALVEQRGEFERMMTERQQQLAAVRGELETQATELERRLEEFDARRSQFEKVVLKYQKESPKPVASPLTFTPDRKGDKSRKKTRKKMLATLDAPTSPPAPSGRRKRWIVAGTAGALVAALVATILIVHNGGGVQPGGAVKIGKTTILPSSSNIDQRNPSRGGFLSQSAGGTVVPGPVGAPLAKPSDSVAIQSPSRDTTPAEPPPERPRPKPKREGVVDAAGGMIAPPRVVPDTSVNRDTMNVADSTRSDSLPARDPGFRYDTTTKRDSIIIPGSIIKRDTITVGRDTPPRRDSSVRRDSAAKRDSTIRPDSLRIRPPPS